MKSGVEVWAQDNYGFMKGESYSCKVAEFENEDAAIAYMCSKLETQLLDIAENVKSVEELLRAYKFGGTDYFIKGSLSFSSWEYVEQEAKRVLNVSIERGKVEKRRKMCLPQ